MSSLNFSNFISNLNVTSTPNTGYDLIAISSDASSSGYLYLGSLLIQWGTTGNYDSGTGHMIDLNVSYDNATDYMVTGVPFSSESKDGVGITIVTNNQTKSEFQIRVWKTNNTNKTNVGISWVAIGKKPSGYPTS